LHLKTLGLPLGFKELGNLSFLFLLELLYLSLEGCVYCVELCSKVLVLPFELHGSKGEL